MKISIISINFNNCKGLELTIQSVINQNFSNYEYIIIDGGSADKSAEIIRKYSPQISFWVSEHDKGIYNAMNKGIVKATGDYLIFLNSGDCFSDSNTLQNCFDFIENHPDADIYYGDIFVVNDERNKTKWLREHPASLSLEFFKHDTINHQASLIKAELFNKFGLYPENYKVASDYWLFLNCLFKNKKFSYLGFPMVDYDLTGISFHNYETYRLEKQAIWNLIIPLCVQEVINEYEECKSYYKSLTGYKLTSAAIKVNHKYQKLKKRIFSKKIIRLFR